MKCHTRVFSKFLLASLWVAQMPSNLPATALEDGPEGPAAVVATALEGEPGPETLRLWKAGMEVDESAVRAFGLEHCFVSQPLDETLKARVKRASYKAYSPVPIADLRYLKLLHYNARGRLQLGEMVCHKSVAADLVYIFRKLYEARYCIERMVLIDDYGADDHRSMLANNTSCYNCRYVAGTRVLSNHSWGTAVDINPLYNPYVVRRQGRIVRVDPKEAAPYARREKDFPYKIAAGDKLCRLFRERGFRWGGDWRSKKDYQHFEKPRPAGAAHGK